MNEIFGIQVCRRLFEAPKRKRPAASFCHDGGMLANLVPEVRLADAKKLKSRKDSRRCDTSVLATMVRYNSPPRSNKEMKEMSSSVMAMDYSDPEKKDVAMSVFEMICQQETRNVTSGVHRPSHRQSAKQRRLPPQQGSHVVRLSSKAIDALSVLESVPPVQGQMAIGRTEIKGSKRRDKRERRFASEVGMRSTASKCRGTSLPAVWNKCIAESTGEGTKGSKHSENHSIFSSSAKHNETKATMEQCRETIPKGYPTTQGKCEIKCAQAIKTNKETLERRTCRSSSCNATFQLGELREGARRRALSHAQVTVAASDNLHGISGDSTAASSSPAVENLLEISQGSIEESSSPAFDVSTLEEAAITLLRLLSSKSESEDDDPTTQQQSAAFERNVNAQDEEERKRRRVQVTRRRILSPLAGVKFVRRSNRTAAPTQRFVPVDTRKRKRLTGVGGLKALQEKVSNDEVGEYNNSRTEPFVREGAAEHQESEGNAMKSAKGRMRRTRKPARRSPRGENKGPPKNLEELINETQGDKDKSVTITGNKEDSIVDHEAVAGNHQESNMISDKSGDKEVLKTKKMLKSDAVTDSPCRRSSSRLRGQVTTSTPPNNVNVVDDFFDSIQRRRRVKPYSDGEESIAEEKKTACVVKTRGQRNKSKDVDCRHQKGKGESVGSASHLDSTSNNRKPTSKKMALGNSVMIRCGRNVDEPSLVDLDVWTQQQIASLRSAYANADPCSDQFWEDIAKQIDGQGEDACREKWFSLVNTPAAKKTQIGHTKKRNDAVHRGEVDEDDLFNSTPMRLQLLDDCDDEKKHQVFDIDFGSPIVVDESCKGKQITGYDEEAELDVVKGRMGYSKTYVKNLKREISKGGKEKVRKKKIRQIRDTGPRGISSAIDYGDLEVKGTLSPGGTMRVRTIYWNGESDDDDDLFVSDEE